MRCFKSFFKHTWHPQQMHNSGPRPCMNSRDVVETELNDIKTTTPEMTTIGPGGVPCHNGGCKTTSRRRPEHMLESPWHYLKTIFLVSMIVAFIVWLIVYVSLAHYGLL